MSYHKNYDSHSPRDTSQLSQSCNKVFRLKMCVYKVTPIHKKRRNVSFYLFDVGNCHWSRNSFQNFRTTAQTFVISITAAQDDYDDDAIRKMIFKQCWGNERRLICLIAAPRLNAELLRKFITFINEREKWKKNS